tara:strand:+ start:177 stop:371 length:195 start_codon:yes stop_codon:yes gene_type:complete
MDGWTSKTSSKTITYSKKRYISGGGGGISGTAGATYEVQYSNNLYKWNTLSKITLENASAIFMD